MKTLLPGLLAALLLFSSCDPNADKQIGRNNRLNNPNPNNGSGSGVSGGSIGSGNSATADAPFDGGLSLLLVGGAAYGLKRMKGRKQVG